MERPGELEASVQRELEALVSDLIENQLDEAGREQLNFLLRDSHACRMHFHAMMDLQYGMMHLLEQNTTSGSISEQIESTANTVLVPSASFVGNLRKNWLAAVVALAAGLLIAVGFFKSTFDTLPQGAFERSKNLDGNIATVKPLDGVVRVRQAAAAEYFDGGPAMVGQVADFDREYVLNAGLVMLEFPNGAEAIIEAPNVFTVASADRLVVKQGRCSVHAPSGAEGFRVDTPETQVVDLGTRFSIDVNEVGRTEVQVIDGAAEVLSTRGKLPKQKLLLQEGQAFRFGGESLEASQSIQFESSAYRGSLPDRIVSYQCVESTPPVNNLKSIVMQRNGKLIEYPTEDLIGVQVVHYVADKNVRSVATLRDSGPLVRDLLESDYSLATGVINPGGAVESLTKNPVLQGDSDSKDSELTPGIGVRFQRPVVNGPGPDVVLFELHSKVNLPGGDGFHVSPIAFRPGLKSHTLKRYDITLKSVEAMPIQTFALPIFEGIGNLLDFQVTNGIGNSFPTLPFYGIAVGIDLSDLGYEIGGSTSGLFFQDDADENRQFDPVFIAGLPEIESSDPSVNANEPKASSNSESLSQSSNE
jgi:hypothetical protein